MAVKTRIANRAHYDSRSQSDARVENTRSHGPTQELLEQVAVEASRALGVSKEQYSREDLESECPGSPVKK